MGVFHVGKDSRLQEMKKRISMATKNLTPKKGQKLEFALINPVAPMGISSTVIKIKTKGQLETVKINLQDKVFVMPEKWSMQKKVEIRKKLILEGWNDCSKCVDSTPQKKTEEPQIYIAGHPDNAPDNPKEGEFVLKYNVGTAKKQIKLKLVKGLIETTDKRVFNAVLKEGFTDYGRKPVKDLPQDEKDPPEEPQKKTSTETGEETIQFD